jgi:hypothetical protein
MGERETSAIKIVSFQQSNMTPVLHKVKTKCHNCLKKKLFVVKKIPFAGICIHEKSQQM